MSYEVYKEKLYVKLRSVDRITSKFLICLLEPQKRQLTNEQSCYTPTFLSPL